VICSHFFSDWVMINSWSIFWIMWKNWKINFELLPKPNEIWSGANILPWSYIKIVFQTSFFKSALKIQFHKIWCSITFIEFFAFNNDSSFFVFNIMLSLQFNSFLLEIIFYFLGGILSTMRATDAGIELWQMLFLKNG